MDLTMDKSIGCEGAHSHSVTEALDRIRILFGRLPGNHQEKNKLLVRNYFRAIDAGDPAGLDQYVSVDYVDHNPQFPNLPPGIDGVREGIELALGAWSNFHHEIVDQIAEGDKVVSRINAYATHVGEFLGVQATHKEITMSGIAIHRIANGKLVEHWSNIDQVGVLKQLGVLPAADPSPARKRPSRLPGGRDEQ
jgi:predicted ester cyclase